MPHFDFVQNEDGSIAQTLRDGEPYSQGVKLEQVYSIVTTYFKAAAANLHDLKDQDAPERKRHFGLQSFLMALTGLEAFTNTYFHVRAQELDSDAMVQRIKQAHGSLSRKIVELVGMTPDGPLVDQERLIEQVYTLSQLRNEIVHPRWTPVSAAFYAEGAIALKFEGMVENQQRLFEEHEFCREALLWCLLAVARIGQARGHQDVSGFMFHWTGNYQLGLDTLLTQLGLPPEN